MMRKPLKPSEAKVWQTFCDSVGSANTLSDCFVEASYAGNRESTDALLGLYLAGKKFAGSSLTQDFITAGDPLPKVGNHWIILDSNDDPRCIVKTIDIETYKFKDVPARVALAEGEGDRSIDHWKHSHALFFASSLEKWGLTEINEAEVVTEYFEVKWKSAPTDTCSTEDAPYKEADRLLRLGDPDSVESAFSHLQRQTSESPNDPKSWFELAGAYDFLGREAEALPHYQKVLDLGINGLPVDDRPRIFVQMGSTLRNLKKYDQARKLFLDGIAMFPENAALKIFLGLVEYSDGAYRKAAKLFLQGNLMTPGDHSASDYQRALRSYSDQIDTFPARQRNWMRILTANGHDPGDRVSASVVRIDHAEALGKLMDASYRGTIDHEGETPEQCYEEMKGTIEGKYGSLIESASFVSMDGPIAASACLITLWKGEPLLAFSMTDPAYQGKGLASLLIQKSISALRLAGLPELYLVVTEGNAPAEHLYSKLGFERLGPAKPGRSVEGSR